jgi:hypothetical protein
MISDGYHEAMHWINSLNRHEWFYVLAAVMVCGFFCMRGFGSRNNY